MNIVHLGIDSGSLIETARIRTCAYEVSPFVPRQEAQLSHSICGYLSLFFPCCWNSMPGVAFKKSVSAIV